MLDCPITWTSSDESILSIGTDVTDGVSQYKAVQVDVNRPDQDTVVTLTATIASADGKQKMTKTFDINVKAITYEIGSISAVGAVDDIVIMSQFSTDGEPAIEVTNAAIYSGKKLPESAYTVETVYKFAEKKTEAKNEVRKFNTAKAGVYEITKTVILGDQKASYTYTVYVVSGSAEIDVDFVRDDNGDATTEKDYTVTVNNSGYNITATLTNVSGTLYSMVADKEPTAEELKANGTAQSITWDSVSFDFTANNSKEYTIYFVIYNPNGDKASEVYSQKVEIVEVSTPAEFQKLISNGTDSYKIYRLTSDLDFTGISYNPGTKAFTGMFDGDGHTISNLSVENTTSSNKGGASIFYRLYGGTIINVNFDKIELSGVTDVGIVGQAYSGYIANIKMTNIRAIGDQRIGGLVGHAYEQVNSPLIIDRVSLVNTDTNYVIYGTTSRSAGILGFIQTNSATSLKSKTVDVRVSNCYVYATIGSDTSGQNGGIVGCYDTSSQAATVDYSLTITNCYSRATVRANSRAGGILAYQQGLDTLRITGCVSFGTIYHAGAVDALVVAQKNASCIVGGYNSQADARVTWCYARFAEHNSNYGVEVVDINDLSDKTLWEEYMGFDFENVWNFNDSAFPYASLK
jgi:hypothetical protein